MKKCCLVLIVMIIYSFVGCAEEANSSLSASSLESENQTVSTSTVSEQKSIISIKEAERIVQEKYLDKYFPDALSSGTDMSKYRFTCETVQIIDNEIYYLIKGSTSEEDRVVAFGWYFVNIFSGAVYDAGPGINELNPF